MLINILPARNMSLAERDDAAIDLAQFARNVVIAKLIEVAQNCEKDDIILSSSASFAKIIIRSNLSNSEI